MPRSVKRKARSIEDATARSSKGRSHGPVKPSQASLSGLEALPVDIMIEILEHMRDPCYANLHIRTLYSLCLTSRWMYLLAKPYLYHTIQNQMGPPVILLSTLLKETQMADCVSHIRWFDSCKDRSNQNGDNCLKLSQVERRQLCRKVDELGLSYPKIYSRAFHTDRAKHHLTALLLLTPNIRSIHVADKNLHCFPQGYYDRPLWLRLLGEIGLRETAMLSRHFQFLKVIHLCMGPIQLLHVAPMLNIPSLRTLTLEDAYQKSAVCQRMWNNRVSKRSSPIENLYLENSYIDSRAVAQLIRSIRGLKLFDFDYNDYNRIGVFRVFDEYPELYYPTLTAALLDHKDTLEQLTIHNRYQLTGDSGLYTTTGAIGSLRDLHCVHTLSIGLECIDDPMVMYPPLNRFQPQPWPPLLELPSRLERLCLGIPIHRRNELTEDFLRGNLEEVAKALEKHVPNLTEATVLRREQGGTQLEGWLDKAKAAFAEQGVVLHIQNTGPLILPSWFENSLGSSHASSSSLLL